MPWCQTDFEKFLYFSEFRIKLCNLDFFLCRTTFLYLNIKLVSLFELNRFIRAKKKHTEERLLKRRELSLNGDGIENLTSTFILEQTN